MFHTIKGKILGLVVCCIAALLCMLAFSVTTLSTLETEFDTMKLQALDGRQATTAINRDVNYIARLTRNIMLGSNADKDIEALKKRITAIEADFAILRAGAADDAERALVAQAQRAALAFVQDGLRFAENMRTIPVAERAQQYGAYSKSATPLAEESRKYFGELTKVKEEACDRAVQTFHNDIVWVKMWTIGLSGGIILIIITLCCLLRRAIVRPLTEITEYTQAVAAGDYNRTIDVQRFRGELGITATSVASMVQSLRAGIAAIEEQGRKAEEQAHRAESAQREAEADRARIAALLDTMNSLAAQSAAIVRELNTETTGLTEDSREIAHGADSQRARAQETATAMEEMTATINEVARNASLAAGNMEQTRTDAENGLALVRQVITVSGEVQTQTSGLQTTLGDLSRRVEDIGAIMGVISDIADQTNLLALNAAIEAARAGDAGRGFAVVADEVRKLAEKTMTATREVGESIKGIQAGAGDNVRAMHLVSEAVTRNSGLTHEAGNALEAIAALVSECATQVTSIATSAEQQSIACEDVNKATAAVSEISAHTSESVARSVRRIRNIAGLAEQLRDVTDRIEQH